MTATRLDRRSFVGQGVLAGMAVLGWGARQARAATRACLPARSTVRWIVPFSAGGGYDVSSRAFTQYYADHLGGGARIGVVNMGGAGSVTGHRALFTAAPDGLTQGMVVPLAILPARLAGLVDFNPADFTLLGRIGTEELALVVNARLPYRTLDDLLASRQTLVESSTGSGTVLLASIVLRRTLGFRSRILTGYPGSREVILAVARGDADACVTTAATLVPGILSGELRPLVVLSDQPLDDPVYRGAYRGVPLLREVARSPQAAHEVEVFNSLLAAGRVVAAPPGMPAELAGCLARAVSATLEDARFVEAIQRAGQTVSPLGADGVRQLLAAAREAADLFADDYVETRRQLGL